MSFIRWFLVALIFVAMLVGGWMFAARNGSPVDVDVLAIQFSQVRLWLVLLAAFAAGALLAGLVGMWALMRARMVARRYRRTVSGLESEVHQLRNLPLASGSSAPDPQAALDEVVGSTGTAA